jgi:hypothetical protein
MVWESRFHTRCRFPGLLTAPRDVDRRRPAVCRPIIDLREPDRKDFNGVDYPLLSVGAGATRPGIRPPAQLTA